VVVSKTTASGVVEVASVIVVDCVVVGEVSSVDVVVTLEEAVD
jgi:hypothetical protein